MKKVRLLICSIVSVFGVVTSVHAQTPIIRTFAGTGSTTFADGGPATAGTMNNQYMINMDPSGNNLYIADNGNNRVRKIDLTTNIITTVAGNGTNGSGGDGGPATAAQLASPGGSGPGVIGVCADALGNVYITDGSNHRIRKVDASGIITNICGSTSGFSGDGGPATAAQIAQPRGIWVDATGNIYFSEGGGTTTRIRKIDAAGIITTIAGNGTAGYVADGVVATTTRVNNPRGLCTDVAGNVYFADFANNRVRRIDAVTNIITTVAGNGGTTFAEGVAATSTGMNGPLDVKIDAAGDLYIALNTHSRVRKLDMTTGIITTLAGSGTAGNDAGNWGPATAAAVRLASLSSVAVNADGNYIYISDRQGGGGTTGNRIKLVKPNSIPYFTGGSRQTFSVCEDQVGFDIGTFVAITDSDRVQTETWTMGAWTPLHGTISMGGTMAANGGVRTPTGWSYTPASAYVGTDSFIVNISDGYNSSADTLIVTVNPLPVVPAIGGSSFTVCEAATITLTNGTSGGAWSASNGNATVNSTSGLVTGVTAGTVDISYTVTNSCGPRIVSQTVTVNPLPVAGSITGASAVCVAATTLLSVSVGGGVWSASNANATVDAFGNVTGANQGTTTISYTVTNGCGAVSATKPMTIDALPAAISGANNVCEAASITLSTTSTGGTWSASNSNATVSGVGLVTGVTAGTVDISYTLVNSCGTNSAVQPVTVNPLPHAGVISGSTNVCIAGTVPFSSTLPGGTWSASNSNATVDGSGNVTGVTVGTVDISYSVTNGCGTDVAIYNVNVVSTPTAGTITGPSNVCPTATITLTDATAGGVWSASNSNATVSGVGLVTGVTAGTVDISYTVTASCGVASTFKTITVDPLPNPGTISGSANVCFGGTTTLTSSVSGGAWSSGATSIATVTGGVVSGMAVGSATISYGVTNVCGTLYATHVVNVNPIVTPSVSFTAAPGFNTCPGTLVTYSAIPVNGGSTPVYEWRVNGFVRGAGGSFNHTPVNGDVITVRMTTSASCVSTTMVYDTMTAVVYPTMVPVVSISSATYGDTVCVGTAVPYTATPIHGGTTPSYTWYVNGIASGGGNPFTYTPSHGDVITASMTSSYVCPSPATVMSNSVTMTVDVTQDPAVTITASPNTTICIGSNMTFTAHQLYGGIAPLYTWSRNGINVATGVTFTYAPANGDIIRCAMTSSSPCRTADVVTSNNIRTSVISPQPISVTISQTSSLIGVGQDATFTATVVTTALAPTYQWYVNGVAVAGATNNTYTLAGTAVGAKTVNCVAGTGDACYTTATSNILSLNVVPAGVADVHINPELRLAPNPNKGVFTVHMLTAGTEPVHVIVTNIIGKKVKEMDIASNKDVEISLNQPAGIYLLSAITDNGTYIAKVYVQ